MTVDVKKVIKDLADTDWGADNDAQMKAVQLLKGLALSDEDASNVFMQGLSDASTSIAKTILAHGKDDKEDKKDESASTDVANKILEGMDDMDAPTKVSDAVDEANKYL